MILQRAMYENASKGAARREIFADSKFLYSLIEKRSVLVKRTGKML